MPPRVHAGCLGSLTWPGEPGGDVDGGEVLGWRVRGALATVATYAGEATDEELWVHRPHPGGNLLGFTLWHAATIVDWTVHVLIRGCEELRFQDPWAGTGIDAPVIPFGMPTRTADAIAGQVDPAALQEYTSALAERVGTWLDGADAAALQAVPETTRNVDASGLEQLPGFLEESAWMHGARVYELVGRPCIGHVFFHAGEAAAVIDRARAETA